MSSTVLSARDQFDLSEYLAKRCAGLIHVEPGGQHQRRVDEHAFVRRQGIGGHGALPPLFRHFGNSLRTGQSRIWGIHSEKPDYARRICFAIKASMARIRATRNAAGVSHFGGTLCAVEHRRQWRHLHRPSDQSGIRTRL
jgi:hypothetical protein